SRSRHAQHNTRGCRSAEGARRRVAAHLDHHPLDAACQSGNPDATLYRRARIVQAVAVRSDLTYDVLDTTAHGRLVLARDRVEPLRAVLSDATPFASLPGSALV